MKTRSKVLQQIRFPTTLAYVTDVEGNFDYWQRYISISRVLSRQPSGTLQLFDSCSIVFGGDVCDRGPGDIRVLQDLVQLQTDYPDRVFLILGNRDINKLRLDAELHETNLKRELKVYWIPEACAEMAAPDRLRWILAKTMGSPNSFELRREELIAHSSTVSDETVTKSYLDLVRPGGDLLAYLENGKIAMVVGDCLFLHGALKSYNIGWLPPRKGDTGWRRVDNLLDWCVEMNQFVADEVSDYKANMKSYISTHMRKGSVPCWAESGGFMHPQPGSRLLQYGMGWLPDKSVTPTVVYANFAASSSPSAPPNATTPRSSSTMKSSPQRATASSSSAPSTTSRPQSPSAIISSPVFGLFGGLANLFSGLIEIFTAVFQSRQVAPAVAPGNVAGAAAGGGAAAQAPVYGDMEEPAEDVAAFMLRAGVRRIIVGHQPRGDAALILEKNGVQVISADTSYAKNTIWDADHTGVAAWGPRNPTQLTLDRMAPPPQDSTRGITVSEILFSFAAPVSALTSASAPRAASVEELQECRGAEARDAQVQQSSATAAVPAARVRLHGRLSNGLDYEFELQPPFSGDSGDPYVGRKTPSGWFVKAVGVRVPTPSTPSTSSSKPPLRATLGDAAEASDSHILHNLSGVDDDANAAVPIQSHYLLSLLDGYNVRNRLVLPVDMPKEFVA